MLDLNKLNVFLHAAQTLNFSQTAHLLLAGRFRHHHPGVRLSILTCTQERVSLNLLEREADFGVVSVEISNERLECQEFFTDHIIFIVPGQHPWAQRQFVEPAELLEVPFILREPTSGTRRAMMSELAQHDVTLDDLDMFLEVGNAEAIVTAVTNNLGVSFVSRLAAAHARAWGCVAEVPVAGIELKRQLCIARCCLAPLNRAQEALLHLNPRIAPVGGINPLVFQRQFAQRYMPALVQQRIKQLHRIGQPLRRSQLLHFPFERPSGPRRAKEAVNVIIEGDA